MLEHRRPALGGELAGLGRAHFVDCLREVAHDVEAVEHLHRLPGAFGDHLQVGLHIRAHEVQRRAACGAEPVEEALQCRGLAFASDPRQTLAVAHDPDRPASGSVARGGAIARRRRWPRCSSGRGAQGRRRPCARPDRRCPRTWGTPRRPPATTGAWPTRRGTRRRRRSVGACRWPTGGPRPARRSAGRTRGAWRRGRPRGCATGHEVEAPDRLRVVARGPAPALRALARVPARGRTRTSMLSCGCSTSRTVS